MFSPFGKKMLKLMEDYCNSKYSPYNFPTWSDESILAFNFHEDLTHAMLVFSPHNQTVNATKCMDKVGPSMVANDYYYHQFCTCNDYTCYVNSGFARIIMVIMYYLTEVP